MDELIKKGWSRRRTDSMASCPALQLACSRSDASWSGSCVFHICLGVIFYGICLKLYPSAVKNNTYLPNGFHFPLLQFLLRNLRPTELACAFCFKMLSINRSILCLKFGKIERKCILRFFFQKWGDIEKIVPQWDNTWTHTEEISSFEESPFVSGKGCYQLCSI